MDFPALCNGLKGSSTNPVTSFKFGANTLELDTTIMSLHVACSMAFGNSLYIVMH